MDHPELTKLRLLYERALREEQALEKTLGAARTKRVAAFGEYAQAGRQLGLCVMCGKALADCRCVWVADGGEGASDLTQEATR